MVEFICLLLFKIKHLQHDLCSAKQLNCVANVTVDFSQAQCLPPCEGLMVTSYEKNTMDKDLESLLPKRLVEYEAFKGDVQLPDKIKGHTEKKH